MTEQNLWELFWKAGENVRKDCSMSLEEGTISIGYYDGKYTKWKLDGTLIYDDYPDKE